MKTVQELIQAATTEALYQPKSFTQNNGIKNINEVRFGEVVANLDPDEDILFCLPYNFTSCVAFTNKRINEKRRSLLTSALLFSEFKEFAGGNLQNPSQFE